MTRLRVAFVGIDNPHGSSWRSTVAMHPEMEPVAFVRRTPEETKTLQPEFARLPLYDSVDELLAGADFDAAVVTLSNKESCPACLQLAGAGKHLLAEKTTARTGAEFQAVLDAVESSGVVFTTGYTWRFSPIAEDIRRMAAEGVFGSIWAWEARYWTSTVKSRDPKNYLFSRDSSGGGMFNWLGCHSIDLMLYLVGEPVKSVTARVANVAGEPIDVEDGGVAIFEFANGAMGSLRCGYYLAPGGNQTDYGLFGSKGWARWQPQEPVLRFASVADDMKNAPERSITYDLPQTAGYGGVMGQRLLSDWLEAIRQGGSPRVNVHGAMAVHRVLDAIYLSSQQGRPVDLA